MKTSTNDIFNSEFSRQYDTCNARLREINDNLHLLISLLLNDLPDDARILCVGVGTGSEIFRLAGPHPGWRFTGIDPSPDMLEVCADKLQMAGISERCSLMEGYLDDVPADAPYDAILCLLVTHFILDGERGGIYRQMAARLKEKGRVIIAEIAGDMSADNFDDQLAGWTAMHAAASQTARAPNVIKAQLKERLLLLPPERTEAIIANAGFSTPQRFFQSLLIHAWMARKNTGD